jgi:hypothetical protein
MRPLLLLLTLVFSCGATPHLRAAAATAAAPAAAAPAILFNTAFDSGSIGLIEKLGETEFRLHIRGQQDARGRNRQATWFYFRMDDVAGREVTLHLTAFKGEYNDKPGNSPGGEWYRPVFSEDNETWTYFSAVKWEKEKDELTLTVQPRGNTIWLCHIPPYPYARVVSLLRELGRSPHARVEKIGESVLGRPLSLVTVTDFSRPDAEKKVVWLQARQHAWECGTSFLMEGALKFVVSDDPAARALRQRTVFKFVPMINPDSVERGEVRFNANGFDPNRQWDEVDLRGKRWLERNPEIWYVKKALLEQHARQPIALALNLHNTETGEYVDSMVDAEPVQARIKSFFERLLAETSFDPARPAVTFSTGATGPGNTTNCIWREAGIPMMLMEQRIGPGKKLGRIATTDDRLEFGGKLIALLAEAK